MKKMIQDKYLNARGGFAKIISISCAKCSKMILVYQKDGFGNLKRLYFDRILSPKNLTKLQKKDLKEVSALKCSNCEEIIGNPYIYEKEKRKAFRLYQDSITKRKLEI